MTPTGPLDFYFDIISPFGYFASLRIDALGARYHRTVQWKPLLIGVTVLKVMGSRPLLEIPLKGDYIVREAERYMRRHGLKLERGIRGAPMNPLPVMRSLAWLTENATQDASRFAGACFDAYWREGRDLSVADEIARAAEIAGLDRATIDSLAASRSDGDPLRRQVDAAIARGVFGSPFFFVDDEPFFGVTSMETLEAWLDSGGW
jgi:2-hydroxychromene-2-carboxylate isomerase